MYCDGSNNKENTYPSVDNLGTLQRREIGSNSIICYIVSLVCTITCIYRSHYTLYIVCMIIRIYPTC